MRWLSLLLAELCLSSAEIVDWLRSKGGTAHHVEMSTFQGMGRGLVCTWPLSAGDPVLSVPSDVIFSGASGNLVAGSHGETQMLSDADAIAFQLLSERAKGTTSVWAPYLAVLPSAVVTPRQFTPEALEAVQAPRVVERSSTERERATATLLRVTQSLTRAVRAGCTSAGVTDIHACTKAQTSAKSWTWALAIIDSRALTFKGMRHLVPVADLVNHHAHADAWSRKARRGEFFLRHHILSLSGLQTSSDRACASGDQLFEDYGDNPTQVYIEYHGFVPEEENPFDCTVIRFPTLNHDSNVLANRRIELLTAIDVLGMPSDCVPGELSRISQDLSYFIWAISLDSFQLEACVAAIGAEGASRDCEYMFNPPLLRDPTVAAVLLDVAVRELATYSTTSQEDEAALVDALLGEDVRLSIRFRLTQKRVLMQLITDAARVLDSAIEDHPTVEPADLKSPTALGTLAERVDLFNTWAQSRQWPALHVKATILQSHGSRAGTVATKPLAQGEPYIEVPEFDCLTVDRARREFGTLADSLDDFQALLLLLVKHVMAVVGSGGTVNATNDHFGPYLALLPGVDDILRIALGQALTENNIATGPPLFWADAPQDASALARTRLQGSALANAAPAYISSIWHNHNITLQRIDRGAFKNIFANVDVDIALSWPVYRWAAQTLDSRSIWWNGQRHLVPMLDLVNAVSD